MAILAPGRPSSLPGHAWRAACGYLLLLAIAFPAGAQVDESALKSAFVYNIAAFTQWGDTREGNAMIICMDAGTALGAAASSLEGRSIGKRRIDVRAWQTGSACDVLVHGLDRPAAAAPGVLVICDGCQLPNGASAIALVREGNKIRFDVDNAAATTARLGFSSQLLRLARRVL